MAIPRKLTNESVIDLVYTSSMVYPTEERDFERNVKRLQKDFPNTKILESERGTFNLTYLAESERERLKKFRKALREADWILPVTGGTGAVDMLRYLNDDDLSLIEKRRPIITGFSDATAITNYVYFKTKLNTFVGYNGDALFYSTHQPLFFETLQGTTNDLTFFKPEYRWLTSALPQKPIEGVAIGGNLSTFRDLLDVCEIRPRSWEPYILFIEDLDMDIEDLHRVIISLEARGIFKHIVALVVGRMNDKNHTQSMRRLLFFTQKKPMQELAEVKNVFEYLISDVISDRIEHRDPLYILKVDNFGHFGNVPQCDNIFVPIGAKTTIYPDGKIEFQGPFVE